MAVSAQYDFKLKANDTLTLSLDQVDDPTVIHEIEDLESGTLNATSTVPATQAWSDKVTLTAGAATIDLTALDKGNLPNLDLTGLKVQLLKLFAPSTNTDDVVIDVGAANGYELFGDANGQITLKPGQGAQFYYNDALDDIGAADAEIDLSSSDVDADLRVVIVAG